MGNENTNTKDDKKNAESGENIVPVKAASVEENSVKEFGVQDLRDLKDAEDDADIFSLKLLRPHDLLSLELRFKNFTLSGNMLIKKADPALMMVLFPSQSIGEDCGSETLNEDGQAVLTTPGLPAKILISGDSRLVFKINKDTLGLNVNELLNWDDFEMVVNSRAKGVDLILATVLQPDQIIKMGKLINDLAVVNTLKTINLTGLTKGEKLFFKNKLLQNDEKQKGGTNPVLATIDAPLRTGTSPLTNLHLPQIPFQIIQPVAPPAEWETSLEIPLKLFLSPTIHAGWNHIIKLQGPKGTFDNTAQLYELWHTRMGTKTASKGIDESDITFDERLLRILWGNKINTDAAPIPPKIEDNDLSNTSLNNQQRHQLVHESSNFSIKGFTPQPVKAYKLFLTTLGAYLDSSFPVNGSELPAGSLSILKWRHIQTLAREHYVEVAEAGYIMPFGHEASLVTITERKPHKDTLTAANFKRQIVVITQPVKNYNYRETDNKNNPILFNFSKIEILNTTSPLLNPKKKTVTVDLPNNPVTPDQQFIITSGPETAQGQQDVQFKMHAEGLNGSIGEDINSNVVNFQMPLVFVSNVALTVPGYLEALIHAYNSFSAFHTNFNGQKISLAPTGPGASDTAYAAYDAVFGMQQCSIADELQGFLPFLGETFIVEPAYQRLTGLTGIEQQLGVFLEDVTDENTNPGRVFAKFSFSQPVDFGGNTDKAGGFALPNFNLSGLSKKVGAFGGTYEHFLKNGSIDASNYFDVTSMPDPVLFGLFKLSDILSFASGGEIPALATETTNDQTRTYYTLTAPLQPWSFSEKNDNNTSKEIIGFKPDNSAVLTINTNIILNKNEQVPSFSTEATINGFIIGLIDTFDHTSEMDVDSRDYLIQVIFKNLIFTSSAGKSADINIEMADPAIQFGGPLTFINAIQKLIPPAGFSDPPYLDVTATGIKSGYTLALPSLQLGAFTLSNLSLAADVNLPFTGSPMIMGFRFCEKHQPFVLTVSMLGGGGYFGIEVDLHGLRQIDAAIEFGASVSLNLGVASGAVSIMAGIYFLLILKEGDGQNSTQLTGYLRINGAMSILGLITATIELYMAFTYLMDKHKAFGEATVSVKVHVLFFNKSVDVHTSRTFAGSGSDPNFEMTYSPNQWQQYCEAFAA